MLELQYLMDLSVRLIGHSMRDIPCSNQPCRCPMILFWSIGPCPQKHLSLSLSGCTGNMAYNAVITSGLILLLLPNQTSANRFLLFVRHDDMNYTEAKEACESFGGRLAVPGSFNEEERLDVMQCIPPNVVFWTNQRGAKDACLVTFLLDIKCFYEKRFYQHDFLCEAERDSIRYSYYLKRGDVCSSQDIHHSTLSPGGNTTTTTTPVSTTRTPGPELTLSPIRTLQTIGTRPLDGDKTTPSTEVISTQREVVQNGTEISGGRNGEKGSGGVSNIGASAAIAIFSAILILTILGIFYVYVKRKKPELLRKASFWKTPEPVQNEYDTVRPRQGPEHSYGYMRSSDPPGDYLQPNPSAIRSRNIDNIDYLVEADDNIISGVDRADSCQAAQENDYDYIHIDDADCGQPPPPYDLARAIPNSGYEKCNQSQNTSKTLTSHDYYNTPDSKIAPPKDLNRSDSECVTNKVEL